MKDGERERQYWIREDLGEDKGGERKTVPGPVQKLCLYTMQKLCL